MERTPPEAPRGFWYAACLASELKHGPLPRTVLGTPLALFRDGAGRPSAVLDRCPHRNVPLSEGTVRDGELECRYHGWRFDGTGRCCAVPGLVGEEADRRARRASVLHSVERDGLVWVWPEADADPDGEPYALPFVGDAGYHTVHHSATLTAGLHAALENTLDVPHTAFLHKGLFRGGREPVEIEVVVSEHESGVEAEYVGEPRPQGLAGRLLAPGGGLVTHFDRFILPSIAQVEYRLGENHLITTSAFTPGAEGTLRLHAAVTFNVRIPAAAIRPLVTPVAKAILAQDARILRSQAENVARFGGERFASTSLDVMGQQMLRLLRRAGRRADVNGSAEDDRPDRPPDLRRVRMRI